MKIYDIPVAVVLLLSFGGAARAQTIALTELWQVAGSGIDIPIVETPPSSPVRQTSVYAPIACYREAYKLDSINANRAAQLCSGAGSSDAPIACYREAYKLDSINADRAVLLCSGASSSDAPIACYREAYKLDSINADRAAQLCSPRAR